MANLSIQVTIPVGGKVVASSGLPSSVPPNMLVQFLQFQNNSAHAIRYGDNTVSVTAPAAVNGGTAGKGMLLPGGSPGGSGSQSTPVAYATMLSDWFVAGTAGDVIDILFIQ